MPVLEIITIGTELLLGEITDTNSTYIARILRDHGIDIYRITTIGDNPGRITATIKEALERADIIITTGGLGPTVDDPTRQAIADAVNAELVFIDELWEEIIKRFDAYGRIPTENNRQQAYIPQGALPVLNPVGTAPCFIVDLASAFVIALPGVPQEMEYLLHHDIIPFLKDKFHLQAHIIKSKVIHVASMGESMVDELIADLEKNNNPTVGLLAHPGQVDIRVTAKANSEMEANQMIDPILVELSHRLGDNIYGFDGDTLEEVISTSLQEKDLELRIIEFGFDESFGTMIHQAQNHQIYSQVLGVPPVDVEELTKQVADLCRDHQCDLGLGVALVDNAQVVLHVVFQGSNREEALTRFYGGPKENAPLWAKNNAMDFLRRNLNHIMSIKETGVS